MVETGPILDSWMYCIDQVDRNVFIVTYGCHLSDGQDDADPVLSPEHQRIGLFTLEDVADLAMPQGYKSSIATWFTALQAGAEWSDSSRLLA